MVILGSTTTVHAAIREVDLHSDRAMMQVAICTLELMQMALFAGLVIAAIHYRHRLDYHKRLMLLTIGCLLPSAISRLPFVDVTNLIILMSFNGFVFACVGIDALWHRRIHPAFAWGGASLLAGLNLTYAIAMTKGWQTFGASILG